MSLEQQIMEAQQALLQVARGEPTKWWEPRDLRSRAQNSTPGDVMMFALTDLVNQQKFELDGRLYVRLSDADWGQR
jgi:hypothetical protein